MNTPDIIELTEAWARMWNEDSSLAHDLMTDDCVQWWGSGPDLDSVVGPVQQETFVTAARAKTGNVFVPRLYVIDADIYAYLWDVTSREGTVMSGVDVNVLQGNRIRENWTFVGPHRDAPDPAPGDALDRDTMTKLAHTWAEKLGYTVHRQLVVDEGSGRIALLRTMSDGVAGVDLLTVRDGEVEPIWSVTAVRGFRY
jgi:hypothetical protein